MFTKVKYLVIKVLLAIALLFTQTANAAEITNKDFAYKIKHCVESIYANKSMYPKSKQIPLELVIAQAAHESAWGKSRFAIEGNNLFGIRTWNPEDPQLKAKGAPDAPWGVRSYDNWCSSIEHYFFTLRTHSAYKEFRDELEFQNTISKQSDPINLIPYLSPWSEQGPKYVRLLQDIMACLYKKSFYKNL